MWFIWTSLLSLLLQWCCVWLTKLFHLRRGWGQCTVCASQGASPLVMKLPAVASPPTVWDWQGGKVGPWLWKPARWADLCCCDCISAESVGAMVQLSWIFMHVVKWAYASWISCTSSCQGKLRLWWSRLLRCSPQTVDSWHPVPAICETETEAKHLGSSHCPRKLKPLLSCQVCIQADLGTKRCQQWSPHKASYLIIW